MSICLSFTFRGLVCPVFSAKFSFYLDSRTLHKTKFRSVRDFENNIYIGRFNTVKTRMSTVAEQTDASERKRKLKTITASYFSLDNAYANSVTHKKTGTRLIVFTLITGSVRFGLKQTRRIEDLTVLPLV
jgi:hypothetical protein